MHKITSIRALIVCLSILSVLLFSAFPSLAHAHAAGIQPFTLNGAASGDVAQLDSIKAYNDNGSYFFKTDQVKKDLQQITNIQYYLVKGQLKGGQYHYPFHISAQSGLHVSGVEIGMNPQTHTQLIAAGTPLSSQASLAPMASTSATVHLWWHDPVNIHLVDVYDGLSWSYNGSSVTSYHGTHSESMFWDGWQESAAPYYESGYGDYHHSALSYTSVNFYNSFFCTALQGAPTFIYVNANEVTGYNTGAREPYIDTYSGGGCTGLINYAWSW